MSFGLTSDTVEGTASVDADRSYDGMSADTGTDGVMQDRRVLESVVCRARARTHRGTTSFFTALHFFAVRTLLAIATTAAPITGEVFGGASDTTPPPVGGVSIQSAALTMYRGHYMYRYQGHRQSVLGGWIPPSPPISQYESSSSSEEEEEEPSPPTIDTDMPSTSSFPSTNNFQHHRRLQSGQHSDATGPQDRCTCG
eukprot:gene19552-23383_t